jgi:hypothetical protein
VFIIVATRRPKSNIRQKRLAFDGELTTVNAPGEAKRDTYGGCCCSISVVIHPSLTIAGVVPKPNR